MSSLAAIAGLTTHQYILCYRYHTNTLTHDLYITSPFAHSDIAWFCALAGGRRTGYVQPPIHASTLVRRRPHHCALLQLSTQRGKQPTETGVLIDTDYESSFHTSPDQPRTEHSTNPPKKHNPNPQPPKMLSTLHAKLFGPPTPLPPRCPGTGVLHIAARRADTDARYTARPLDYFPNPLVSPEQLMKARAEAGVLDEMFGRYKREAECEVGPGVGKTGRRCGECGEWCCNVSFLFLFFFFCLFREGWWI